MLDSDDDVLNEFLDYVTDSKEPDVYCVYNCSTNYSYLGNKQEMLELIDFLKESFALEESTLKLKVVRPDVDLETLRNVDNKIVLAIIERK
jgi:hypothetical protein